MVDSEEEEEETSPEVLIEWERVECSRFHDQPQADTSMGRSMLAIRDNHHEERSIIFPPINHEGLHTSTSTSTSTHSNHDDHQKNNKSSLSSSPYDIDREIAPPLPPSLRPRSAGDVARWLSLGLELLRSKVTGIASSVRNFAISRGILWSVYSPAGATVVAAAAVLLAFLYIRLHWQRRLRIREESNDHLILLIRKKDEKINQLLHQIAQMNEVLLALHRISLSKTG